MRTARDAASELATFPVREASQAPCRRAFSETADAMDIAQASPVAAGGADAKSARFEDSSNLRRASANLSAGGRQLSRQRGVIALVGPTAPAKGRDIGKLGTRWEHAHGSQISRW